jgi:hypothetical protein
MATGRNSRLGGTDAFVVALVQRRPPSRDHAVVRGDPTREITALWDVLDVHQAGRRIDREVT